MISARPPRASLHVLGCRVNQYEIRTLAADLRRRGYELVPFGQPADVCVVNTCTVTGEADAKSRAALRRAARSGSEPLVVATGCYAELAPAEVAALPGVVEVVPNEAKPRLGEIVDELVRRSGRLLFPLPAAPAGPAGAGDLVPLTGEAGGVAARTRAVIKIQDGCNHFCSFCIIPYTRGRLRSRPPQEVVREARELIGAGFQELVLAGICLGDYGDERHSPAAAADRDPLAALLEELASIPGVGRLRLSSLDPADVTDDLLRTMARLDTVCPHLHLSLQAGADEVLQRMRRRYTAGSFRRLVERIYRVMPGAGLTCDVIAGFPGETEGQFQETLRLCEEAGFYHLHAFPYSPRAGTAAARLQDDVPPAEKSRRVKALQTLGAELAHRFACSHVGREVTILPERHDPGRGLLMGLAENYLRVTFPGPAHLQGKLVRVTVTSAANAEAVGATVRVAAPASQGES